MREEIKELRRLNLLLKTQRLTPSERAALEQQVSELERAQLPEAVPSGPGVFGMFDRPEPGKNDVEPIAREPKNLAEQKKPSAPSPAKPPEPQPSDHGLSPDEFEALAEQITAIADRITRLRTYWATTLSVEVDRESEMWLARLHEAAKGLPEELLEFILGDRSYLLRQEVRDVRKPSIAEKVQLQLIAPSAPALDSVGTWSEIYYAIHQPPSPRAPEHPVGYVPDGLQALVS